MTLTGFVITAKDQQKKKRLAREAAQGAIEMELQSVSRRSRSRRSQSIRSARSGSRGGRSDRTSDQHEDSQQLDQEDIPPMNEEIFDIDNEGSNKSDEEEEPATCQHPLSVAGQDP